MSDDKQDDTAYQCYKIDGRPESFPLDGKAAVPARAKVPAISKLATFIVIAAAWALLSGNFSRFYLTIGLISCVTVVLLSSDLLFPVPLRWQSVVIFFRYLGCVPWLALEIFKSSLRISILCFSPRMMEKLDPGMIQFDSPPMSDLGLTLFANSITLTPGTITASVSIHGAFKVHFIDEVSSKRLPGIMGVRLARIFGKG